VGLRRAMRRLDRRVLPWLAGDPRRTGRHRQRRPYLTGLGLVVLTVALVGTAWAVRDRPAGPVETVRVGVLAGQSVPGYVRSSKQALDRLRTSGHADRPVYALVSLTAYLAPDRLPPVLSGVRVHRVYARVPLATVATQVTTIDASRLPADVDTGMARLAADRQRIAQDFAGLAAQQTGTDAPSVRQRAQYQAEAQGFQAEATGYQQHCSCVFGAVVRATPAVLAQLATRPAVRAVDPAPRLASLSHAVFSPPLPEQTGTAGPPDDSRLAPSPSTPPSTTASPTPSASAPADPPPSDSTTPQPPPSSSGSPSPPPDDTSATPTPAGAQPTPASAPTTQPIPAGITTP
jgi:hypothetical protein